MDGLEGLGTEAGANARGTQGCGHRPEDEEVLLRDQNRNGAEGDYDQVIDAERHAVHAKLEHQCEHECEHEREHKHHQRHQCDDSPDPMDERMFQMFRSLCVKIPVPTFRGDNSEDSTIFKTKALDYRKPLTSLDMTEFMNSAISWKEKPASGMMR